MRKVVFAMIEAGGGHKSSAKAIMEALNERYPGAYETRLMDFMKDLGHVRFDARHKASWDFLLRHPFLCALSFDAQELLFPLSRSFLKAYARGFVPHAVRFLREYRPDLIVSTHFLNCYALVEAKRLSGVDFRHVSVVTELFGVQSFYAIEGPDRIVVPCERARDQLVARKIDPARIVVLPYPLSNAFKRVGGDLSALRSRLGLGGDRPVLLISFGSQGFGPLEACVGALRDAGIRLDVLVVSGHNEAVKEALGRRFGDKGGATRVLPLGYVTNMNELMVISDFVFIKPGPATVMEALYSRKPMILSTPAARHEQWNIDFALERGLGRFVGGSPRRLVQAVGELLSEGERASIARRYDALGLKAGPDELADFVHGMASGVALPNAGDFAP